MRYAIFLLVAVLAIAGIGFLSDDTGDDRYVRVAVTDVETLYGPRDYAAASEYFDRTVSSKRERLATAPGEWLHEAVLASALMNRFSFTGEASDQAEARRLLDAAMERAPAPSGPTLTNAAMALSYHDLDTAAYMLDRFAKAAPRREAVDRSEAIAMRGDVAFQRGDLANAKTLYAEADEIAPATGTKLRRANALLWSGEAEDARRLAERTVASGDLRPLSFAKSALLLANFSYAQGDIERAREWIDAAAERFDGYWLVEAYAAQNLAAEGNYDAAIAELTRIARESGEPEVMDTLTGVLLFRGKDAEAARWTARAESAWAEKLAQNRAAYRLHAAEHFLDFGDPARALELAREEVAARPFGEVIEVLASSLTATGDPAAALRWLERAETQGWRAVSLDLARSEALAALGRDDEAEHFLARAQETNPIAGTDERKLVRFGHF